MKLKKFTAVFGLLSIVLMIAHIGYNVFAYLTFYYNPKLTKITAIPFIIAVCLHAVLGMISVFTGRDDGRMELYPRKNLRTILQRVSAALIFPLLIVHINTFAALTKATEKGCVVLIVLLFVAEVLFFGSVITHVVTSLTNALVTLGILSSPRKKMIIDRILYIIGAVCFLVSTYSVVSGQLSMFIK